MSELSLQRFISLVQLDDRIHTCQKDIAQGKEQTAHFLQLLQTMRETLDVTKSQKEALQRAVYHQESELQHVQYTYKNKEKLLEKTKNQRELEALTHELETLKQLQQTHEDTLLHTWQNLEKSAQLYERQVQEIEQKMRALEKDMKAHQSKLEKKEQELHQLQENRNIVSSTIPVELLEQYTTMKQSVSNAVVRVEQGHCTGCFYVVSPADVLKLRSNILIACKNCYRLLYWNSHEAA